jgi:hypothetical protein
MLLKIGDSGGDLVLEILLFVLVVWRDAAPALMVSGLGSAAIWFQRGLEAIDQGGAGKGLAQEANGSGLQRSGANALLGKSGDENERRTVTPAAHEDQQVQTAHGRHLYIRNDARRVMLLGRLQELLGRCECMDDVPVRRQKIVRRGSNGLIIVNDGNKRKL